MSAISLLCARIDKLVRIANAVSVVTTFVIMVLMLVGIATRILGSPLTGITNLSESLFIGVIYLSIGYTQQTNQHVSVEFFLSRLNRKSRKVAALVGICIPLGICCILLATSWDYALESWHVRERMDGAPFYPIYPPKFAIAVGISLLWLQLLVGLLREVRGFFGKRDP